MQVYLFYQANNKPLLVKKALIKNPSKYINYTNIFLFYLILELFENTIINKFVIKLVKNK